MWERPAEAQRLHCQALIVDRFISAFFPFTVQHLLRSPLRPQVT